MKVKVGTTTIKLSPPEYDYGYLEISGLCNLAIEFSELEDIVSAFSQIKEKVSQELMKEKQCFTAKNVKL
jgi:hypothetical protein